MTFRRAGSWDRYGTDAVGQEAVALAACTGDAVRPRILVDGVVFSNSYQRGIQRYFVELLGRVGISSQVTLLMTRPARSTLPAGCWVPRGCILPRTRRDVVGQIRGCWVRPRIRGLARRNHVFHSTYFTMPPIDMPAVVTVHDMIYEQYPGMLQDERHVAQKRVCLEQAQVIIAISYATSDQIRAFYPALGQKVRVIQHGADHLLANSGLQQSPAKHKQVLYVGARAGYKNFALLLEAAESRSWPAGYSIAVVGAPFTSAEDLLIRRMALSGKVVHLGCLADDDLRSAYRRSACFVCTSLEEGFGFPALEAQSLGTVVVCSDRPIFHETVGDAGEFFDPREPSSLAEAIGRVCEPSRQAELIERGNLNVQRFRWDTCAMETLQIYREVMACTLPAFQS